MRILMLCLLVVWILSMVFLHQTRLHFVRYLLGMVGIFAFGVYFFSGPIVNGLQWIVAQLASYLGQWTGIYDVYMDQKFIAISAGERYLSFYIDYECSGFIEILAFVSLLGFYPLYRNWEKAAVGAIGVSVILLTNVMRIFIICLLVFMFGENVFWVAHTIIGRLFFYVISILIYFYVFTRPHIVRQKVKGYQYDDDARKDR